MDWRTEQSWTYENEKKRKCWILHLRWKNPGGMYKLGDKRQRSRQTKRDLGIWIGGKLSMSQQCPMAAKGANHSQEYIKHRITGWSRDVIVPLYTALGWPHLESCVSSGHLKYVNIKVRSIFRGGWPSWGWKDSRARFKRTIEVICLVHLGEMNGWGDPIEV